eukprot:CAMPEP_0113507010 /NCGR_PEP_ID=MMETSP0014_2-20120614/36225_1 /TAXON_ID=2857 /ORGANISM="Nitzschia sp." /LENGTH=341 /DNA_ID=CAMNT_0000402567 /DNA_START=314 /DNA_END=1339 /DNA_ORIENTATION=- /assembly_acc=CAM_ASM_000159
MFRRKSRQSDSLPLTGGNNDSSSFGLPFGGLNRNSGTDGSMKSIKLDAPAVTAWKRSSTFTKWSYYAALFFLMMVYGGYRSLRYWNASIWLTCHQQECTLEVTPPGSRTLTVVFARTQLHSAQAIKTDKAGKFVEIDTDKYEVPKRQKGKKKYKNSQYQKGPDEQGRYRTYRIKFFEKSPDGTERNEEDAQDGDFSILKDYLENDGNEVGVKMLPLRLFGLSQTRTRVRSNINKVESYIKKRRQKLIIKESATLPWQGILSLVFGLLGFLLTLLIGQFWEEPPRQVRGPGARRAPPPPKSKAKSKRMPQTTKPKSFVYDNGKKSVLPPSYRDKLQKKRFDK